MTSRIATSVTRLPADLTDTFTVSREQFEAEFVGARACGVALQGFYKKFGITLSFFQKVISKVVREL